METFITRAPEFYQYHVVNTEEVMKYGMEKAAILGNLDKITHRMFEEIYLDFPYFSKEKFYRLFGELEKEGKVMRSDVK